MSEPTPAQQKDYAEAEALIAQARDLNARAATKLVDAMGWYPEWFEHRLHVLDPERFWNDYWTASPDNVCSVLPLDGMLLDLCCGDGFYDYYWYAKRALDILAIDHDPRAIETARTLHQATRIVYQCSDVLASQFIPGAFDVVVCRGAIEHFAQPDQQRMFQIAKSALKHEGTFVGDTVAPSGNAPHHIYEWTSKEQAGEELSKVFSDVFVWDLVSRDRTTILWKAK